MKDASERFGIGYLWQYVLKAIMVLLPVCVVVFTILTIFIIDSRSDDGIFSEKDAFKAARVEYGCERILWSGYITNCNDVFPNIGYSDSGTYIVGVKDGKEVYILFPKHAAVNKSSLMDWQFAYEFREIARSIAQYGYKYPNGYDPGATQAPSTLYDNLTVCSDRSAIDQYAQPFPDGDGLYDRLDVKMIFYFYGAPDDNNIRSVFWVTQQNDTLVMYEETLDDSPAIRHILNPRGALENTKNALKNNLKIF